ncbi:uncharacterized protein TNCV_844681 [Trichonephila clavipes]|uniref:Uncharacterized protein n=1 Tax=Trichonephila clavipes TaxID=2585209 RepID=A0A8X6WI67_TRICX|nr:uncharacterized protein TNCV_844681 [Trichonephila clavipes]
MPAGGSTSALDTLNLQLESWYGKQLTMTAGTLLVIRNTLTANAYASLVIQLIVLPFMNSIQREVFQQDNAHPHNLVVPQRALQRFEMLPCRVRSPDLSRIDHGTLNIDSPHEVGGREREVGGL